MNYNYTNRMDSDKRNKDYNRSSGARSAHDDRSPNRGGEDSNNRSDSGDQSGSDASN